MIKKIFLGILFTTGLITAVSCGSDDSSEYTEVPRVSPVVLDLNASIFPYEKLSDYHFFDGDIKNLEPVYKVIPYDLNSGLFTDYAEKKRFIWMPAGAKATYAADGKILEFPSGTVLIKNFYYNTVVPDNHTTIIETRLMIKKGNEWIFATYVWNDEQTEAVLATNGANKHVIFEHAGETIDFTYKVPAVGACTSCHKLQGISTPIGVKPQNLNKLYPYPEATKNQLAKLVEEGYLSSQGIPQNIASTVDWTDTSKSLDLRVRSYLDINCAHCHSEGTSCDYTPMRLAFSESENPVNLGVCVEPQDFAPSPITHIVAKGKVSKSLMHFRMKSTLPSEMMPMVGRTLRHTEAIFLIEDWINGMEGQCQ